MWGTPKFDPYFSWVYRFIPTHVGNTEYEAAEQRETKVHPHACGEHRRSGRKGWITGGSSPRMWGTQPHQQQTYTIYRFIPTHVGNTALRYSLSAPSSVHPHACGEHSSRPCIIVICSGSSPRMWGTLFFIHYNRISVRFIPTHVGNTLHDSKTSLTSPVHPHACGEHAAAGSGWRIERGSSPRMWGTLAGYPFDQRMNRFIPTHVGNTRSPALL